MKQTSTIHWIQHPALTSVTQEYSCVTLALIGERAEDEYKCEFDTSPNGNGCKQMTF